MMIRISLAAARINAHYTQDDAAKALHVSNKTITNWETGKSSPSFAALNALADLYHMPIDCISLPTKSTISETEDETKANA